MLNQVAGETKARKSFHITEADNGFVVNSYDSHEGSMLIFGMIGGALKYVRGQIEGESTQAVGEAVQELAEKLEADASLSTNTMREVDDQLEPARSIPINDGTFDTGVDQSG